eukprot:1335911-Amorphochlora_amoeboformis.AAC.1
MSSRSGPVPPRIQDPGAEKLDLSHRSSQYGHTPCHSAQASVTNLRDLTRRVDKHISWTRSERLTRPWCPTIALWAE